ncbi:MAG: NAD(P)H-hydrate dehydratase [Phycisphaeraceae bacterium]|nr:NAD(P)H-hydrate dehydratase [Phycisphaeraceae bacterium]
METVETIPAAPDRPPDSHKGTFGMVIVVGGSTTMIGAPALCARAAFRGGAGLVKIATIAEILPYALTIEPSATGIALPPDSGEAMRLIDEADPQMRAVIALGPGLGQSKLSRVLVDEILRGKRTVVLDADGLNLLAMTGKPRIETGSAVVMTPHPGEFIRLAQPLGISERPTDPCTRSVAASKLADAHHAVIVLKGKGTIVCSPQPRKGYLNTTGNAALATAGSGDILTGLIAALLAQNMAPFEAAVLAVYLHGLAADLWLQEYGAAGMRAMDLADLLPKAFEHHRAGNLWATMQPRK